MFELKLLTKESLPGAFAKAERYRLLNQPWEAESIYLDILGIGEDNQEALVGLVLAITDQFGDRASESVPRAQEVLRRIQGDFERAYYAGIIAERRAKIALQQARPGSGEMAAELLREAQRWYERAEALSPPGNDDALLRWNACQRLILRSPRLLAAAEERYAPYTD